MHSQSRLAYLLTLVCALLSSRFKQTPLRTFFLQVAIIAMHQNGRDTHIRQVKIYAPREPNVLDRSIPEPSTEQFSAFSCIR